MEGSNAPPKMAAQATSPVLSLPKTIVFLESTNESSGRVVSSTTRKTIRSHVMREYRRQQNGFTEQPEKTLSTRTAKQKSIGISRPEHAGLLSGSTSALSSGKSAQKASEDTASESKAVHWHGCSAIDSQYHLNDVTDAFVYAGNSSIDFRSYALFNHYSSEFRLLYCRHTLPAHLSALSSAMNVYCATIVQQNSAALLHAICFYAASHQGLARGSIEGPRRTFEDLTALSAQRDTHRHKSESLRQLNKALRQNPPAITEGSILCVTILRATEAILGDVEAVKAHTLGMSRLIEAFGGIENLSSEVAVQIHLADIKAAIVADAQPSFPMGHQTRRRFEIFSSASSQSDDSDPSRLGSSFFLESVSSRLSPELQQCLRYARYIIVAVEAWFSTSESLPTLSIEDFLILEHRLLSLPLEKPLSSAEDCIRIAVLLYTSIGLWNTPLYAAWVERMVTRLKTALATLKSHTGSLPYPELALWMLFLGRYAVGAHMKLERAWFNVNLLKTIQNLKISTWQDASQILSGFFYVDRVFHKRFFKIWCAILIGSGEMEDPDLYEHPCRSGRASASLKKFLGFKEGR